MVSSAVVGFSPGLKAGIPSLQEDGARGARKLCSAGSGAASALFRGFRDPGVGRAADTRTDLSVLVGEDACKALGNVRAAVVTLGHWAVVTPAGAGTIHYPVNR